MLQEVSGLGRFDHILGNLNSILMYVYHCRYIFFFFELGTLPTQRHLFGLSLHWMVKTLLPFFQK